jgi:hypothetical protein
LAPFFALGGILISMTRRTPVSKIRSLLLPLLPPLLLAGLLLGDARPVLAMQLTPQQKDEIKLHYQRATRAYDLQKYQEAIEEYKKAYEIGGDPPMLYNIAQAYRLNDQPAEAISFYRRYLQRSPNARNREDVERKIADQEKEIEDRRKAAAATTPPAPSTSTATPPTTTTPAVPYPVTQPPTVVSPPPPVVPPEPPSQARLVVGWSMIGAGLIADGVAIYQAWRAKDKSDQLTRGSMAPGMNVVFNPAVESEGKTAELAAIVLGISGTAVAIAGAIILITSGSSTTTSETGTQTARVSFSPLLGSGLVGGGARLVF